MSLGALGSTKNGAFLIAAISRRTFGNVVLVVVILPDPG